MTEHSNNEVETIIQRLAKLNHFEKQLRTPNKFRGCFMKPVYHHMPPNHLARIDHVWLFVSVDENGNEGVVAADFGQPLGFMPLIAADDGRLAQLVPLARAVARDTGMKIRMIKMAARELVEEIDGNAVA